MFLPPQCSCSVFGDWFHVVCWSALSWQQSHGLVSRFHSGDHDLFQTLGQTRPGERQIESVRWNRRFHGIISEEKESCPRSTPRVKQDRRSPVPSSSKELVSSFFFILHGCEAARKCGRSLQVLRARSLPSGVADCRLRPLRIPKQETIHTHFTAQRNKTLHSCATRNTLARHHFTLHYTALHSSTLQCSTVQ